MERPRNSPGPDSAATIVAISISTAGIPKRNVEQVEVTADGLVGDQHAHEKHRRAYRAVSVQDVELLDQLVAEGHAVGPGIMGENLTVRGLDVQRLAVGDRLLLDHGPVLELTEPRRPCYVLDAVHPRLQEAAVGRCGYLCRVIRTGMCRLGQSITVSRSSPDR
ncbi:MAG: MOSC domain-containing protein [bacterium]